ncbi:MAG: hypothetical protein GY950_09390, partial [bacterium]|nr:hypothetical protein [bacterium]
TNWQIQTEVKKSGSISAAPAVDLLAGLESGYKKSTVKFLSMTDGTQKGQVEFPGKAVSIGLDAKGTRLVLLANGPKDQEPKKKTPKELKGLEKDTFKQKNDGKVSILAEFAVPSGKKISQKTIFFSSGTPTILVGNKTIDLISYSNVNARIVGNKITLYKGKSSYNYGIGISPDRKAFLVGGLRSGTRVNTENLIMTEFNINRLPGWPEYYKGFGFAKDGTGYATTTAYRLIKISKTGNIEKQVPIY